MEVHAHTHTPRKKWTHYFWEFLMLFFAVFCGFIAENQREHFVEHQREKQYMKMLLADIKRDTAFINGITAANNVLMKGLDSLTMALDTIKATEQNQLLQVYRLFYTWGYSPYVVQFSERTISQLRSAGGMRLLRKQAVSDAINTYYIAAGICDDQAKVYFDDQNSIINLSYKFFDKLYMEKNHVNMELAKKLMAENPFFIREFINRTNDFKEVIGNYNSLLDQIKTMAFDLDKQIKKEYSINAERK